MKATKLDIPERVRGKKTRVTVTLKCGHILVLMVAGRTARYLHDGTDFPCVACGVGPKVIRAGGYAITV